MVTLLGSNKPYRIGDVDEKWHNVGVFGHQMSNKVHVQVNAFNDNRLVVSYIRFEQRLKSCHHQLALLLVTSTNLQVEYFNQALPSKKRTTRLPFSRVATAAQEVVGQAQWRELDKWRQIAQGEFVLRPQASHAADGESSPSISQSLGPI